jgi:hypothetical protein
MSELLQTLPTLKMIDPCEDCHRNCYKCKLMDEHFRVQADKIRKETRDEYLKLHHMPKIEHVPHDHGIGFNDCSICDNEITDASWLI